MLLTCSKFVKEMPFAPIKDGEFTKTIYGMVSIFNECCGFCHLLWLAGNFSVVLSVWEHMCFFPRIVSMWAV